MKRNILFVCTGNVCRSPMAAVLFEARARRVGDDKHYAVSSAGTWSLEGEPASSHAVTVMQRRGLSLQGHRARTITPEMMREASLVVVMTRYHQDSLSAEFPHSRPKIHLMSELVGQQYDIGDPYGGTLEEYEICAAGLSALVEQGYAQIAEWLALISHPNPGPKDS